MKKSLFTACVIWIFSSVLAAPSVASAGFQAVPASRHEQLVLARAKLDLQLVTNEETVAFEMAPKGIDTQAIDDAIRQLFDPTVFPASYSLTPVPLTARPGPTDPYLKVRNQDLLLAAAGKVLAKQNASVVNALKAQASQIDACTFEGRLQQAVSALGGLTNPNSIGQKNSVAITGLVIPVLFYACTSPQSSSSPNSQKGAAATAPAPTPVPAAVKTLEAPSSPTPTPPPTPFHSAMLIQAATTVTAAKVQDLLESTDPTYLTVQYSQLLQAARTEASANMALTAQKDATDATVSHCQLVTNLETAVAGFKGLSGTPSVGTKNTIAITGIVLPVIFYACRTPNSQ